MSIINIFIIIPFVIIYSCLYFCLLPIFIIRTIIKDKGSLFNKLGFNYKKHQKNQKPIHIHCVSVGEFNASIPLIDKFLKDFEVVITTTTKTGRQACLNHYGNKITHYYFPFDLGFICKRFLKNINPKVSIILETEIWANFLNEAQKVDIKTYLINARLSNRSLKKYQKFANFSLKTMHKFEKILVQDEFSNDNFKKLGVKNSSVIGNLKFDINPTTNDNKLNIIKNIIDSRDFIACVSTHNPEEKMIIKSLKNSSIKDLVVIIPRHPQRFKEVENILITEKINYIKQSDNKQCSENTQVLLADSMGFVLEYYALCKFAFVGGSFSGTGGHNMLESIAFNKLTTFGTDTFNFKSLVENILKNNAGLQIKNIDELWNIASNLNNEKYQAIIKNSKLFFDENTGTSEKVFKKIVG
jgi:3-deoxy-D-manno-octulosonic-acid transferase